MMFLPFLPFSSHLEVCLTLRETVPGSIPAIESSISNRIVLQTHKGGRITGIEYFFITLSSPTTVSAVSTTSEILQNETYFIVYCRNRTILYHSKQCERYSLYDNSTCHG